MIKQRMLLTVLILGLIALECYCVDENCSLVISGSDLPGTIGPARVNLGTGETAPLLPDEIHFATAAITADPSTGQLFISDAIGQIFSVNLFNTSTTTRLAFIDNGFYAIGMAADTNEKVIFMAFLDDNSSSIAKMNYNGSGFQVILSEEIGHTSSLSADELERKLYFNNYEEDSYGISRSNYDGSFVEEFRIFTLIPPTVLAVDTRGRKLYFSLYFTLEVVNLDGTDRQELYSDKIFSLTAIAYINGLIYFAADITQDEVKTETRIMSFLPGESDGLRVIATYSNETLINGIVVNCTLIDTNTEGPVSTTENPGTTIIIIATAVSIGSLIVIIAFFVIICCCFYNRQYLPDKDAYSASQKHILDRSEKEIRIKDVYLSPANNATKPGYAAPESMTRHQHQQYLTNRPHQTRKLNDQYLSTIAYNNRNLHPPHPTHTRNQYLTPIRQPNQVGNPDYIDRNNQSTANEVAVSNYGAQSNGYDYITTRSVGSSYNNASNMYEMMY